MNYYQHHLGDYTKDTMDLSPLEHGVYRLLMDAYYATEKPVPADFNTACRIARCVSKDEQDALSRVLSRFFTLAADGYRQKRIDEEIAGYQEKVAKNRENGRLGGRPANPYPNPPETQTVSQTKPKANPPANQQPNPHETLSSNQEPITKKKNKKGRLPDGFAVSPAVREWAAKHDYDRLDDHLAYFRDWAIASGASKEDWDATFRNAVRGNWAKLPRSQKPAAKNPWDGAK